MRSHLLREYYLGRIKRLLLPYLGAALVYYLVFTLALHWFSFSWLDFLDYLKWGTLAAPFYFLYALAQFILLAPLFQAAARRWSPTLLLPAALGITWISSMYFNSVLQLVSPGASFPYSDRIFTSYLIYFLAGCCIGARYDGFLKLLRENRSLITGMFIFFACADGFLSLMAFSGRTSAPYLEMVHTLYLLSAILFLFDLAVRLDRPLPSLAARVDRASYLIYLYHALVITLFNSFAGRLGIAGTGPLLVLRAIVVYSASIGGCVLWQALWNRVKTLKLN